MSQTSTADATPPILQFVLDKSTSMNSTEFPSTMGQSKWVATRTAFSQGFAAMPSNFMVGEFFYPNATGGCVNQTGGVAANILSAPGILTPTHVGDLQAGIMAVPSPTSPAGTPTHDAYLEGLRRLQAVPRPLEYQNSPGYIVLVTDGMPVRSLNCGQAAGDNIAVTEVQFNEIITEITNTRTNFGIQTFVIAVPGSEDTSQVPTDPSGSGLDYLPRSKLSEAAQAGGTATPGCDNSGVPFYCDIDMVDAPDFVAALTTALGAIATRVISCSYEVPPAPAGSVVDTNRIRVDYTPGGGTVRTLGRAGDSSCVGGQWYVSAQDPSGMPTQLELCPSTCDTVMADLGAIIEVTFECIYQL
jgi:hypothetical protein